MLMRVGMRMASPMTATVFQGIVETMPSHIPRSGTPARAAVTSDGSLMDITRRFASWDRTSSSISEGRWSTRARIRWNFRVSRASLSKIVKRATSGPRNLWASSRNTTRRGKSSPESTYRS